MHGIRLILLDEEQFRTFDIRPATSRNASGLASTKRDR